MMPDGTCENCTEQMSKPGTWCDSHNIIIQETSNALNCIDSNTADP